MDNEEESPYDREHREKKQKQILRMIYNYRRTPE